MSGGAAGRHAVVLTPSRYSICMVKKTYKINGMHCPSCAMLVEGELEDIGVKATCSYAKQVVAVDYDKTKVTDADIREAIARGVPG